MTHCGSCCRALAECICVDCHCAWKRHPPLFLIDENIHKERRARMIAEGAYRPRQEKP